MKKITSLVICLIAVLSMSFICFAKEADAQNAGQETAVSVNSIDISEIKTYISLGADLSEEQKKTVLDLMGVSDDNLDKFSISYVTNKEEHEGLDTYIDPAVIGTKSLSSVLVKPLSTGSGVKVTTKNINYCSEAMYQSALITAGVTDAEVMVVAPFEMSGTAALIGALKAYEQMSGERVSAEAKDTALNELVATGEVSNAIGDDERAMELIAYIKAQIAANNLDTREDIEAAVKKGNEDLKAGLTEEQIQQIVDVMVKIKAMGIDFDLLAEQAEVIYAKYGDQIKNGTFRLEDVDFNELGLGKFIEKVVNNFFVTIGNSIKGIFGGLTGK